MPLTNTANFFENEAAGWDNRYEHSRLFRLRYQLFKNAIAKYGKASQRSLDYGCGSGVLTGLLQQTSKSVVATDLAENMLKLTRDKFRDCPSVEVAPITSIKPLEFDLLVCSSVIEYVDHPAEFLRMLADYVRPHGVLLITFANKHAPLQIISRHFLKHMKKSSYANIQQNAFSKSLIRRLSDQSQLEIVSLATPVGLPVFARLGLGELHFLVARKKA